MNLGDLHRTLNAWRKVMKVGHGRRKNIPEATWLSPTLVFTSNVHLLSLCITYFSVGEVIFIGRIKVRNSVSSA